MSKLTPVSSLVKIRKELQEQLGNVWMDFEVETILLTVNMDQSEAMFDKVSVLQALERQPELFYQNALFFVNAVPAINGFGSEKEVFSIPTSLEIAFAMSEVARLLSVERHEVPAFDTGVKMVIQESLINDGFSRVVPPFDVVGGLDLGEIEEVDEAILAKKEKAIREYVSGMQS